MIKQLKHLYTKITGRKVAPAEYVLNNFLNATMSVPLMFAIAPLPLQMP
jgi:hypothetical protein